MRKVLVGIGILVAGLAMTRAAGATPLATLTWRTEVNMSGQLCVYGTFDDKVFDVFGTSVNLSSTNPWLCTGQVGVPFVTVHCEAVAGPTVLSYDVTVPYDGSPGPPPGIFSPFVGSMTNVSGSAVTGLGSLTYTVDGQQAQRTNGLSANDIPNCSISGGVAVFDGLGGINAFQSVATSTGTDIPVNTTLTFTDPITGQPHTSDVGDHLRQRRHAWKYGRDGHLERCGQPVFELRRIGRRLQRGVRRCQYDRHIHRKRDGVRRL